MNHVAIDNSVCCSLALRAGGETVSVTRESFGRDADRLFLPFLRRFLKENGLAPNEVTHWSIGTGPGSFAGIRFTLALVKGICTVTSAKSRGIPAFYALARKLGKEGEIAILHDARCGKVLLARYRISQGRCLPVQPPEMRDLAELRETPVACDFVCTSAEELLPQLPQGVILLPPPEAVFLLDAEEETHPWLDTPDVEPLYVRPPA